MFDCLVSAVTLVVVSPVLLLCAVAIKCTSTGPVYFRQRRIGRDGKPFMVYKFRTMFHGSENGGSHITVADDPRITWVGRFLRRWKLDEFPQLINVLRGEMSLVGPRPQVLEKIQFLTEAEREILALRPGITGLSALCDRKEEKHLAGVSDVEEFYAKKWLPRKVAQELYYANNLSFTMDLRLILLTIVLLYVPGTAAAKTVRIFGQEFKPFSRVMQMVIDLIIAAIALQMAYWLRFEGRLEPAHQEQLSVFMLIVPFARVITNWILGVYKLIWRYVLVSDAMYIAFAFVPVSALLLVLRLSLDANSSVGSLLMMPRSIICAEFLVSSFGCLGMRAVRRFLFETEIAFRPPMTMTKRLLLVGAGSRGAAIAHQIMVYPEFEAVGFIDDDPMKQLTRVSGVKVLGTVKDIPDVAAKYNIGGVIVCGDRQDGDLYNRVKTVCAASLLPVHMLPDLSSMLLADSASSASAE